MQRHCSVCSKNFRDIRFHLEIHPALLSDELKEELTHMPDNLLHLEAGIQSLREEVLTTSRRMGKLSDALEGLKFLCSLSNMETHADLIAGLPLCKCGRNIRRCTYVSFLPCRRNTARIIKVTARHRNEMQSCRTRHQIFSISSL